MQDRQLCLRNSRRHRFLVRLSRILLLIGLGSGTMAFVFALVPNHQWLARLSIATAYTGLAFLMIALIIGPFNLFVGRSNPVSSQLRREIGIIAGVFAVAHTVLGLQVHFSGNFATYFFYRGPMEELKAIRTDPFGLANYFGLAATLTLFALLLFSNNLSMRLLTIKRWKNIQRFIYPGAAFVALHGVIYQILENRGAASFLLILAAATLTITMQIFGLLRFKQQRKMTVRSSAIRAEET